MSFQARICRADPDDEVVGDRVARNGEGTAGWWPAVPW
jgi:hypothetical protein